MADSHKNFSYSTVLTAPSPATSGTSLVLASGGGALMPTVPFNATVWPTGSSPLSSNAEIVRVTAIATDTLTITRTQESSSARTVVVGDQIAATVTKKTLTDLEFSPDTITLLKTGVVTTASTVSGNTHMAFDGIRSVYIYNPAATNSQVYKYDLIAGTTTAITGGATISEAYAGASILYAGTKLYMTRGGGFGEFSSINTDGTGYTFLTNSPTGTNFAGAMAWDGDNTIYLMNGGALMAYSISGNSWTTLAAEPSAPLEGASITIVGNFIYALKGAGTTTFWKYDITANAWSTMAVTPATIYDGGSLSWNGGAYIYALRGNGGQDFYRYSIATNVWETMQTLPAPASTGSGMVALSPGNFLMYLTDPSGITAFGVYNNLYLFTSYSQPDFRLQNRLNNVDNTSDATKNAATATLTNKTLTSPKINQFLDTNGLTVMNFNPVASAVNYIRLDNNATLNPPNFVAVGTDTDISINFIPKNAGRLTVSSVNVPTTASTDTFTNKRLTPRISTSTSSGTPSVNTDNFDGMVLTAQAAAITTFTLSGSPTDQQRFLIRIKATGAFAITAPTNTLSSGSVSFPTTTVSGKTISVGLIYDTTATKFIVESANTVGY